ncbi:MAG TPA: GatB/YqeY domain-containing protein [Burkholderiales bacterium]|nr:GatB/YqeY domain-containing protein [Burkholderiales bacterium]
MALRDQINEDLKTAMRAGDAARRDALRLLTAALKQKEVDERKDLAQKSGDERKSLGDPDVVAVIDKMIKQRRDSIAQFRQGGRGDLADKEQFEISVLERYMPAAMSEADIDAAIAAAIAEAGAKGPSDMGKVMGPLKAKLAGRADMSKVSARVKQKLAG